MNMDFFLLFKRFPDKSLPSRFARRLALRSLALAGISLALSCVSQQKYDQVQNERESERQALEELRERYRQLEGRQQKLEDAVSASRGKLDTRDAELRAEKKRTATLENQIKALNATNKSLLDRLSDLSVISKSGAESIKKSLDAINSQNMYIKDLNKMIQEKDQLNLALVKSLKRSLADIDDEDVTIDVKKGVVYISLSDKMLFKSGSYEILPGAESVLGKIASVVNDHNDLDILVEGHTDSVPISNGCMVDNWDLSAKRATAVVRNLQTRHNVQPERMTAGGRGEYLSKASNATEAGRSLNRRTEILLLPKLDQFFKLVEPPAAGADSKASAGAKTDAPAGKSNAKSPARTPAQPANAGGRQPSIESIPAEVQMEGR